MTQGGYHGTETLAKDPARGLGSIRVVPQDEMVDLGVEEISTWAWEVAVELVDHE
jgi:hypothetical protein